MRLLVAALIVATLQIAVPARAAMQPLCGFGVAGIAPLPDGKTYALQLVSFDGAPLSAVFDLHSQLSDYRTTPTTVGFSPITAADAGALRTCAHFASGPVFVSLPKMDQLFVARASTGGGAQGEACTPRAALTTAYLRRAEPDYQPSAEVIAWRQRVAAATREALNVVAAETPGRETRCEIPNARAHMTRRAKPSYPKIAEQQDESAVTSMRIEVDETGAVTNVSVISSGANPALDGAAIAAIKISDFEPAAYHCLPVPGVVLFGWLFHTSPKLR